MSDNKAEKDVMAFTDELTSALIRRHRQILVRIDRNWQFDDSWTVVPDRSRAASAVIQAQDVAGWEAAMGTARRMAQDIAEYEDMLAAGQARLLQAWPREAGSA